MFETAQMLYLYVETPLHAGTGSSVGIVDLPIQRERHTKYPMIQSSGIKGKLRAEAYETKSFLDRKKQIKDQLLQQPKREHEKPEDFEKRCEKEGRKKAAKETGLEIIFGPEGDEAELHAGAISPGDARLLLFPIRSLVGVFAWATSNHALARFKRDLEATGKTAPWTLNNLPDNGKALTVNNSSLCAGDKVVLEEFAYDHQQPADVGVIANWLADNALPQAPPAPAGGQTAPADEYKYFRDKLRTNLVILPETDFRDFTQFATEIVTRIKIDQSTKTVADGALWTEEHLPSDTLLYTPLHATRPRGTTTLFNSAQGVLDAVIELKLDRLQLGGDETVGRGLVKLHFGGN